jgi:hypothetical protein
VFFCCLVLWFVVSFCLPSCFLILFCVPFRCVVLCSVVLCSVVGFPYCEINELFLRRTYLVEKKKEIITLSNFIKQCPC